MVPLYSTCIVAVNKMASEVLHTRPLVTTLVVRGKRATKLGGA